MILVAVALMKVETRVAGTPAKVGDGATTAKIFREHAVAREEAAGVLSKEERLMLLRLLKKIGKVGKTNLSTTDEFSDAPRSASRRTTAII